MDCIFIDFVSAYNTINREILFNIKIIKKTPADELNFLYYC